MKGRNPHFINLRNQSLVKRYYFWYDIERLRRDDVLEKLSELEFFLDIDYIARLLKENHYLLKELRANKPNARQLQSYCFTSMPVQAFCQASLFSQSAVQAV